MASKILLTIGGIDYTSYIDIGSVHVDNNVVMTSDSAGLTLQLDGELPRPFAGQEFIWSTVDTTSGVELARDFGGVVVQISETTEGPSLMYNVVVKSYEHWFNRHLVVEWYSQYYVAGTRSQLLALVPGDAANMNISVTNGNGDGIVNRIVKQYCPGFTCNNVMPTPNQIVPQYFNYTTPSNAIKNIADQLEYGFYIDYYKDVHFYPFEQLKSPLPNNVLDVDNDLASYGDLELVEDGQQVYNRIFLRGFKTRSANSLNLSFPGDDTTVQWSLGYRVSSLKNDISVAVYMNVANYNADISFQTTGVATLGVPMTMKKDIVDGAPNQPGGLQTAYIHYTQHLLRIPNYDGSMTPVSTGQIVAAHFYYMKDVIYMGQDAMSQVAIAAVEGSDGVYEYSQEDKSLTNSTIAAPQSKAQLLVQKYGVPQITGSFESYTSGWRAGQSFTLVTRKRMGGINTKMYVLRVTKTIVNNINGNFMVRNQIEFANSPYLV